MARAVASLSAVLVLLSSVIVTFAAGKSTSGLGVGAAEAEFEADDGMVIGGSIQAGKLRGHEGKLRVVAVVVEKPGDGKLAIVACDVLMLTRDLLDPVVGQIKEHTGITASHVLINATHTHHAPSTVTVHGYKRDETFCRRVQEAIVKAVREADATMADECTFHFALGREETVGQNSRQRLEDGTIYWIGPRDTFVRATGPFDSELPVLAFRNRAGQGIATIFNHSTHTIGMRQGGKRSPSFYGLAAQELETELGGKVSFLEGASGSTHNLTVTPADAVTRMKQAVRDALAQAKPREVTRVAAVKQSFKFHVRSFDEAKEDAAVTAYCRKYAPTRADDTIEVFRAQRKVLAPQQGQERETWVQAMVIGDVALVGVPAEFFTKLGLDIKNRSPFRHTYVAELANDWIGYLPDRDAHVLGGYQTWTGLHSYAEPGTGERVVQQAVEMLKELAR
ncbi:MAG TPA: hypothetical protein VI454_07095 [Verrucomicrobiae bacterium]